MSEDTTETSVTLSEEWERDKEEMGISGNEWVRRMVRLGRRQYGYPYDPEEIPDMPSIKTREDQEDEEDLIQQFLLANLSKNEFTSLEDLISLLEQEIEESAKDLERRGIVESSFSEGGFKLNENWQDKIGDDDA